MSNVTNDVLKKGVGANRQEKYQLETACYLQCYVSDGQKSQIIYSGRV